jgi:hypothetical protein
MEVQQAVVRYRLDQITRDAHGLRWGRRARHEPRLASVRRGFGRRFVRLGFALIEGARPGPDVRRRVASVTDR